MKSFLKGLIVLAITIAAALPVFAQDDTAKKMNDVPMKSICG